jgi:hypothetical protein
MRAERECPLGENAAAFVAGELTDGEREVFVTHLAKCEACARAVESTRSVISLLHATPAAEVTTDLAPSILAKIHQIPARATVWPRVAAMAAAAAILLVLGLSKFTPRAPQAVAAESTSASVERALDWLCQAQEPDGSWSAARWGGDRRFEVALTALPLMALLNDEHTTPPRSAAIARAVEHLRREQAANGSFGGEFFGSCYNQGIATLALLRAYQRHPTAELKSTLDDAFAVIEATQTSPGGWGYLGSPQPHPAITLWNVEALKLAATLGWNDVHPSLDRGTQWMQAHAAPTRQSGSVADVDFYSAYFLASALKHADDASSRDRLTAIRRTLLASQIHGGSDSGSWAPDDQWGRVGGRLYSTALASLSLR